jgi:hypothetical protein
MAEVTPEVRPNILLSLDDVHSTTNYALERPAKSSDELMCRLIEEWDVRKFANSKVNPSSSSCAANIAQTNPQTYGTLVGGTTMSNPSAQPMNHFHIRTTIDGSTPTFGMPQQTMTSMFQQGYTHTVPSFFMPKPWFSPIHPHG